MSLREYVRLCLVCTFVISTITICAQNTTPISSGGIGVNQLLSPSTTTVTPTIVGTCTPTTWTYAVTAVDASGGSTLPTSGSTSSGCPTLGASPNYSYNKIQTSAVTGSVSCNVYRTAGGAAAFGIIGSVICGNAFYDLTDAAGDGTSVPGVNTTGSIKATAVSAQAFNATGSGAGTNILGAGSFLPICTATSSIYISCIPSMGAFFQQAPSSISSSIGITWPNSLSATSGTLSPAAIGPFLFGAIPGTGNGASQVVIGSLTNPANPLLATANANFTSTNSGNVVTIDSSGNAQSSGTLLATLLVGTVMKQTGSNYSNNSTSFTTFQSVPIAASQNINFDCELIYKEGNTSGKLSLSVLTPTSPANVDAEVQIYYDTSPTVSPANLVGNISASGGSVPGGTPVAVNTPYKAKIYGGVENGSTSGTLAIQAASLVAGTITILRGSYCQFF